MPQSIAMSLLTGAALSAVALTGAVAVEPAPQAVITAPAPDAVLLDLNAPEAQARGADVTLQNDALIDGGSAILQFGFANGEIGAARYNIDPGLFPIKIKRVQIFWASALSNGTQSLQDSILIYTGNFNLLANLEGPVMTDGALNEFDLEPLNIVINSPTQLTVGLQFFDAPNGDVLKGTLATDNNGCQSGLNWVFIPGNGSWFNLCSFGVSGDLVIRTIIDPMGAPPACPEDLNGDNVVDTADLGLLLAVFGQTPPSIAEADINNDGTCDTADLGILLAAFGTACP
ncbi:MAG: hypothetical protein H6813_00715 [Phycisphaeraceae bacterium]|nr:hypothetical protein [Phycisphaeraceae bacterium]MCB9847392.1 hypothetical protein [Phycisphaeraceae bacterium]